MVVEAATTNPTKASSPSVDDAFWRRVGDSIQITYSYHQTNNTGAGAGSGTYIFKLPPGLNIDESKLLPVNSEFQLGTVGAATVRNGSGSAEGIGIVRYYNDGSKEGLSVNFTIESTAAMATVNSTNGFS